MASSISDPLTSAPRLVRWAVRLAAGVVVAITVSYLVYGTVWATAGANAVIETAVEEQTYAVYLGGLVASVAAFALAIVSRVREHARKGLWLPLSVFPVLVALLVIALIRPIG